MGITQKVRGKTISGAMQQLTQALYASEEKSVKSTLSATVVKALYTTPQALVPAPGAGKINVPLRLFAKYTFGTTAYTGSNALEFRYTSSSGAKAYADINASFLLSASGTNYMVQNPSDDLVPVANAPIVVNVPTANPGQGLGGLEITVWYKTITP